MIRWGASEEAAVRRASGGLWHRLRSERVRGGVDGIPDVRTWTHCGARIPRADEVTRWGRPSENRCRKCWR